MTSPFDLSRPRRIHVVGVGGAGMSAVAIALAEMGHQVTGSDLKFSPILERLRAAGVQLRVGHRAENVAGTEVVTVSTAVPASNLEVTTALAEGIPVLSRAEMLASIRATRRAVAVAGTHGKTTTASMLALVLVEGGLRPSFIVGGELNEIGTGALWDEGDWLVIEADESDGSFLDLSPDVGVITSVEPDHLDRYGSFDALESAFESFLASATSGRIVCSDDPVAERIGRAQGAVTYGTARGSEYELTGVRTGRSSTEFEVRSRGERIGRIELPVPGIHNALNAGAALAAGLMIGVDFDSVARGLSRFTGVARRFQFRGIRDGVTYVDDYAHLPTEIRAALDTAVRGGWERVVCVFQPHRYSRTASLWRDFADAFVAADLVVVTDVYAAGEAARPGVSGKLIVEAALEAHPESSVVFMPTRSSLVRFLRATLREGDVCVTLGAGDLTSLPDEMMSLEGS